MRVRALVAVGLVLLPSIAESQLRRPGRMGGRAPGPTAMMPEGPAARPVSEARQYQRLNVAIEGYPMISRVTMPSIAGVPGQTFATGGSGTRFEYRFARLAAGTMDVTQSVLGGPIFNSSAELGLRFGPNRFAHDIVPFVDARAGYFYSVPKQQLGDFVSNPQTNIASVMNFSHGPAAIGGAGVEFAVSRRFSVTTAANYVQARMTARPRFGTQDYKYTMRSTRFIAALRYNGVRAVPTR
jgi:hypothetical protein